VILECSKTQAVLFMPHTASFIYSIHPFACFARRETSCPLFAIGFIPYLYSNYSRHPNHNITAIIIAFRSRPYTYYNTVIFPLCKTVALFSKKTRLFQKPIAFFLIYGILIKLIQRLPIDCVLICIATYLILAI